MSIILRRNPLRELVAMRSAMDRIFEDTWRGFDEVSEGALAIDVHESADDYTVKANLPGVAPEDIDVRLSDGVLTVSGEIRKEEKREGEREVITERMYGSFSRSLRLPRTVEADRIDATFDAGVLTLKLPKAPESKPKQISIKTTDAVLKDKN